MNYYNENDLRAAAWLRELIAQKQIPAGDVDTRSITDVTPSDLKNYVQCHFFAGIGGWSEALAIAGWPERIPVWTGSCPCQPFSCAGQQRGTEDERHLWPAFFRLIEACRPPIVFGEQVAAAEVLGVDLEADFARAVQANDHARANKLAKQLCRRADFHFQPRWLDGVFNDLEGARYTCAASDLPAASVGAPHIRQRLFWVARAEGQRWNGRTGMRGQDGWPVTEANGHNGGLADPQHSIGRPQCEHRQNEQHGNDDGRAETHSEPGARGEVRGLADAGCERRDGLNTLLRPEAARRDSGSVSEASWSGYADGLGDTEQPGLEGYAGHEPDGGQPGRQHKDDPAAGIAMPWTQFRTITCLDGKARHIPTEPAFFPLASGVPARMVRLRGYGNAIVPHLAAQFIIATQKAINL